MEKIDIKIDIKAPIEKVFDVLSDHEKYSKFNGILSSKLIQWGEYEKNGKGAIRQLDSLGGTILEEILAFKRNDFFEYKVIQCYVNLGLIRIDIPLVHLLGRVNFKETEEGTEINWVSVFDLDIPFLREEITKIISYTSGNAFYFLLQQLKFNLELNRY